MSCLEHDSDAKQEEKIKQTQGDERQLVNKLLNKNDILEQLTFMKYELTKHIQPASAILLSSSPLSSN
jgi:hypothetical protein